MTSRLVREVATPPMASRSPSQTSVSDAEVAQEESADESDFQDVEEGDDGPSSERVQHMLPAIATPRLSLSSTPWPYTSLDQLTSPTRTQPEVPASSLPHEILLHILRLLPTSSLAPALRVCKSWCQCGVELLWHKPVFTRLSPLFRMLQIIPLTDATFPYPTFIRRLNFSQIAKDLDDRILESLRPCTQLERLTLASSVNVTSQGLTALLSACENLVALDLSDVPAVNDDVVQLIASTSARLQGLNLSNCKEVTDMSIEAIAKSCPSIRRIKLRGLVELTDAPIALLSLKCPLLLEIDLIGCYKVTDASMQQLWRTSLNLRELSLQLCSAITDRAFPSSGPTDAGDEASQVPGTLQLTDGSTIPVLPPLVLSPSLRLFDHVRYLDLTSLTRLTDSAIAGIAQYMPKIRNLILNKCTNLTDDSVYSICALGKNLHYLHMGHVSSLTDRAVTKLARSCTRLRYIDLAGCVMLTDMSVFELAQNLHRLKRIGLVRVNNLTDEAVYALFCRTSLERIHLSYCENISVVAINELLNTLHKLTHLSLTGIPAFRRDDLQQWCRPPPADFNAHQRAAFCVYSGKGVSDLRKHLAKLNVEGNHDLHPVVNGVILDMPRPVRGQRVVNAGGRPAEAGGGGGGGGGGVGAVPQPHRAPPARTRVAAVAIRDQDDEGGQHRERRAPLPRQSQLEAARGGDFHPYSSRQIPIQYVGPTRQDGSASANGDAAGESRSNSRTRASAPPSLHSPFNYAANAASSSTAAAVASARAGAHDGSPVASGSGSTTGRAQLVASARENDLAAHDTSLAGWRWNAAGDLARHHRTPTSASSHITTPLERSRPTTGDADDEANGVTRMDVDRRPSAASAPDRNIGPVRAFEQEAEDDELSDDEEDDLDRNRGRHGGTGGVDEDMDGSSSARNSDSDGRRMRRSTVTRHNFRATLGGAMTGGGSSSTDVAGDEDDIAMDEDA